MLNGDGRMIAQKRFERPNCMFNSSYGVPQIQMGECSRCGECCRWIIMPIAPGGIDFDEYYFHHGIKIDPSCGLLIPSICQHLKKEDVPGNVYSCDIYDKRPVLCHNDKAHGAIKMYKFPGCTQS